MIKKKVQTVLFCRDANKQIQFLLLRTNKERGSFWQNVTGSVDLGEDYQEAAIREAVEETGITQENIKNFTSLDLEFTFRDRWGEDVLEKAYLLEVDSLFEVKLDPREHEDFKWAQDQELDRESVKFESNWSAIQEAMKRL